MNLSRQRQIAAILGRFNGDRKKAMDYCEQVAKQYPKLWDEYMTYRQTIELEGA